MQKTKSASKEKKIERFQPQKFEEKWKQVWQEKELYKFHEANGGEKYYNLVELPYPSGDLHIGHWFTFVTPDIHARYMKMSGKNVFFPNGFDAFGLPAENAAIKRGINPKEWTLKNISTMRQQFANMGTMIDWSHEVITCLPEFYKWNQWIFIKMFEKGLAYRGKALSNWCPVDQTVLANEAIEAGRCWRCGSEVVQKEIEQWFLKITEYADELLWPENPKENWPKSVRVAQNEWIGKSEGMLIEFFAENGEKLTVFTTRPDTIGGATFLVLAPEHPLIKSIITDQHRNQVNNHLEAASSKTERERKENKEKTGVFTGGYAINPLTKEKVPVWVADYVLMSYGTGAIMAVPAHDERDFEFAKKFNLPIKHVIAPETGTKREDEERRDGGCGIIFDPEAQKYAVYKHPDGRIGFFAGGTNDDEDTTEGILREVKEESGLYNFKHIEEIAKAYTHFYNRMKNINRVALATCLLIVLENTDVKSTKRESHEDFELEWLVADEVVDGLKDRNQKKDVDHWLTFFRESVGRAIELGFDKTSDPKKYFQKPYIGKGIIVNSDSLSELKYPKDLARVISRLETMGVGKKETIYHLRDWSISRQRYWGTPVPMIHCKKCGINPVPLDELPVLLPDITEYAPKGEAPLATAKEWLRVDCPKCGGEARRDDETLDTFFDSSWYYYRYMNPHLDNAPFSKEETKLLMPVDIYFGGGEHTLGHTLYARFFTKFFKDLGMVEFSEFAKRRVQHGIVLGPDGNKMSKSKGNVINPDDIVGEFGVDATRTYLAFMMPYEGTGPWSTEALSGVYRFLRRVWELAEVVSDQDLSSKDLYEMHRTIKKVGEDLANIKTNTAVAALMEWINYLSKREAVSKEEYKTLLLLLAPFAPFMIEELWQQVFGSKSSFVSVHSHSWPKYDAKYLQEELIKIPVQVNGKLRDVIEVQSEDSKDQSKVEALAMASEKVKKHLSGTSAKKIFYINNKLINIIG